MAATFSNSDNCGEHCPVINNINAAVPLETCGAPFATHWVEPA